MHDPVRKVHRKIWRDSGVSEGMRAVPEETAIALTYNGGTYAVMMGTPQDLEDFAIGFSLSEGIVQSPEDIDSLEVVPLDDGIELRMWLAQSKADHLSERRRHIAGPTGCGICGIDSIAEAVRPAAIVAHGRSFTPLEIMTAMQAVPPLQKINMETRTVHAAAFWTPARGIVALREDVGRHNALDKLAGGLAQRQGFRRRRHGAADQQGVGRDGAEDRGDGRAADGRGVGADGAGGADGGCGGHHACRDRARRRVRGLHASGTN